MSTKKFFETDSRVLQNEYAKTANLLFKNGILEKFKNKTVLVTGGTGLLGTQITKTILCCNRLYNSNVKVIILSRNKKKVLDKYNPYCLNNIIVYIQDIREPIKIQENVNYIFHCASPTESKFFVDFPVETIDTIVNGTINILNYAKNQNLQGLLYFSSLEAYGDINNAGSYTNENDIGIIDFLNVRSSYSESKRMCECVCQSFLHEFNVPIFIARFTQIIGADVEYNDNRFVVQLARSVYESKDIVLKTEGNTIRNYCDITDAISAVFYILAFGTIGEAYNVANKDSAISIYDLANYVCKKYKDKNIKVSFNIDYNQKNTGYNKEIKIKLGTKKLESLGWSAHVSIDESLDKIVDHFYEKGRAK